MAALIKKTLGRLTPCWSGSQENASFSPLKSAGHDKRLAATNNKFFIMMHTSVRISMRVLKRKLWEDFPECGITGMILRMSDTYFILQAAMISQQKIPEENIKFALATTFGADLIDQKNMYDIRMPPVGVYAIRDIGAWTWYCFQLSMTDSVNSNMTRVKIAYGASDIVTQLVRRPSFDTFVSVSRDVTIPAVIHPSNVCDGSSLVTFPKQVLDRSAQDDDDE